MPSHPYRLRVMTSVDSTELTYKASYLPLLLASAHAATEDGHYPLDRIRMQKAIFLITHHRVGSRWRDAYPYRPYNWGPYSIELNDDLVRWQRNGAMVLSFAGDARYGRYVLTKQARCFATACRCASDTYAISY